MTGTVGTTGSRAAREWRENWPIVFTALLGNLLLSMPVLSVNRSMDWTVRISPVDGACIPSPRNEAGADHRPRSYAPAYFFLASAFDAGFAPPSGQ